MDVLKDLLPDIEDDVLAGALQEPDLRQLAHHRHHQHQQVEDADPLDALAVGAPQHAQLLPGVTFDLFQAELRFHPAAKGFVFRRERLDLPLQSVLLFPLSCRIDRR